MDDAWRQKLQMAAYQANVWYLLEHDLSIQLICDGEVVKEISGNLRLWNMAAHYLYTDRDLIEQLSEPRKSKISTG